jgi:protein phosphatase
VVVDYFEIELRGNSQILLCSDGLTNMLTDEEILKILRGVPNMQKKVDALIDAANKNGGTDNISVVSVIP